MKGSYKLSRPQGVKQNSIPPHYPHLIIPSFFVPQLKYRSAGLKTTKQDLIFPPSKGKLNPREAEKERRRRRRCIDAAQKDIGKLRLYKCSGDGGGGGGIGKQ